MALGAVRAEGAPQWIPTETHAHPVDPAVFLRTLADDEALPIVVVLRLRNREALGRLATALTDPRGPAFRRWLGREEIVGSYAPTEAQAGVVARYLLRSGFTDVKVGPGRMLVSASGSAKVIRNAFDTELAHFRRNGREGVANTRDVRVPLELGDTVLAVLGLQTLDRMEPMIRRARGPQPLAGGSVQGLDPVQFPIAYDAAGLPPASATAVAIIAEGDLTQTLADLQTFESQEGLPVITPKTVPVGTGSSDTSNTDEWDLDSQDIQAMAGGQLGQMIFYVSTSLFDSDLAQTFSQVVNDDIASVINVSLGECERAAMRDGAMAADDQIFQMAVAQGQTFSVSSGDFGALECGNPQGTGAGASYPASSPSVIAVGGTTLSTDALGHYAGEVVWGDAGGSPSRYEPQPAWQNGVVPGSFRGVPDLAFDADPNSGAIIVLDGAAAQYGGTSLSSPLFVGAWARIQTANAARLGFPVSWIYSRGAAGTPAFHDVVSGSNGGYSAGVGWDYATGFGSFDVAATALLTRSTVTVSAAPSPIVPGQPVLLSATVSGNSPTGTVQFFVDGVSFGSPVALVEGTATLSTTALTELGLFAITASYSGDGNDAASATTAPFVESVVPPQPVPALPGAAALALGSALLLVVLLALERVQE